MSNFYRNILDEIAIEFARKVIADFDKKMKDSNSQATWWKSNYGEGVMVLRPDEGNSIKAEMIECTVIESRLLNIKPINYGSK